MRGSCIGGGVKSQKKRVQACFCSPACGASHLLARTPGRTYHHEPIALDMCSANQTRCVSAFVRFSNSVHSHREQPVPDDALGDLVRKLSYTCPSKLLYHPAIGTVIFQKVALHCGQPSLSHRGEGVVGPIVVSCALSKSRADLGGVIQH
jgi:hypothetical protein